VSPRASEIVEKGVAAAEVVGERGDTEVGMVAR
jgi:hypothetical protein